MNSATMQQVILQVWPHETGDGSADAGTDDGLWHDDAYHPSDDGLWHDGAYFLLDDGRWHDGIYF